MHLITNQPFHSRLELAIDHFQDCYLNQLQQKNAATMNVDGLRLGSILPNPKCRDSVAGVMTMKSHRKKSDVSGDLITHFFTQILQECFLNNQCVAKRPFNECYCEFPEEEKVNWDPNHSSLFENQDHTGL